MAILHSTGILIVDSYPTHEPTDQQATLAKLNDAFEFWQWNGVEWIAFTPIDNGTFVKSYAAVLTGTNDANPTDSVARNTLGGAPVWARTGEGVYTATLTNGFAGATIGLVTLGTATGGIILKMTKTSFNVMTLSTFAADGTTPADFIGTLNVLINVEP